MTQPQTGKYMYVLNVYVCMYVCMYDLLSIFQLLVGVLNNYYCPAVCTSGAVRLVGGTSSNEGKLEYCYNGVWSSVCYSFRNKEATVACKQLGFSASPSKNVCTNKYM